MEELHHVRRQKRGCFCTQAWALAYTSYTRDFPNPNENQAVNSSRSPLLSCVFGVKVPPSHKSQILYDTVEIALSRMQSAKAASSADELPWLRERQWHVSFAPSGCTENRTGVSRRAAPHPPNGSTSFMLSRMYSRHGSHLLKKIFVLLFFQALHWPRRALADCFLVGWKRKSKCPLCRTCCTTFPSCHLPPSTGIWRTSLQAKQAKDAAVRRSKGGHVKIWRFLRCHDRRVKPRARNSQFHDRVSWNYCLRSANALPIRLLCCSGRRCFENICLQSREIDDSI